MHVQSPINCTGFLLPWRQFFSSFRCMNLKKALQIGHEIGLHSYGWLLFSCSHAIPTEGVEAHHQHISLFFKRQISCYSTAHCMCDQSCHSQKHSFWLVDKSGTRLSFNRLNQMNHGIGSALLTTTAVFIMEKWIQKKKSQIVHGR